MITAFPSIVGVLGTNRWTPASLTGLYSWFDAQKASSLTVDGSNNVTQWNDLFGSGQLTGAASPGYATYGTSVINGKPGIIFTNSSGSTLTFNSYCRDWLKGQSNVTIFMVMSRTDTVDDRVYYYWSNGTSSGSTRYGMTSRSTGAFSTYYRQLDADSLTLRVPSDSNSPGSGTPFIYRLTTEYTSADTSMFLSNVSDTSEYGSMTLPSSNAVSNTSSLLAFLGKGTASYFCPNFKLGELIITRAKPTASEISQLYSYFRVRWGAL